MNSNLSGNFNTAYGAQALQLNTTGSNNSALGRFAGVDLTTGNNNIDIGNRGVGGESNIIRIGTTGTQTDTYLTGVIHGNRFDLPLSTSANLGVITQNGSSLLHTYGTNNFFAGAGTGNFTMTGGNNTAIGAHALQSNSAGSQNMASGHSALQLNTTGDYSTASGFLALGSNTTGGNNTANGVNALGLNTTGNGNIALGVNAGYNLTTGNSNIDIGNSGTAGEGNTIRIGEGQTKTFLAGVRGVTTGVNNGQTVLIDGSGQLGTVSSSRRYKDDIADMGDASKLLMSLRPVTFRYKKPYDNGEKPIQFGLIAEEVAEVFPELTVYNAEGQPETVKYQDLPPLLLNELQKLRKEKDELAKQLAERDTRDKERDARITRLESLLPPTSVNTNEITKGN